MAKDALLALGEVADLLEKLRLRFVVGGSLASGSWGEPRATHDADVLIDLPLQRVSELFSALQARFYVDEGAMRSAVHAHSSFNAIHLEVYQKVDLFVAGTSVLDTAQLERAVPRLLGGQRWFPVTSAEVVVLRKLDWFRKTDETSDRQWRDVQAVLRIQQQRLDRVWMGSLAEAVGLADLLQRAMTEAWGASSG
jgi:hypothetical protein